MFTLRQFAVVMFLLSSVLSYSVHAASDSISLDEDSHEGITEHMKPEDCIATRDQGRNYSLAPSSVDNAEKEKPNVIED